MRILMPRMRLILSCCPGALMGVLIGAMVSCGGFEVGTYAPDSSRLTIGRNTSIVTTDLSVPDLSDQARSVATLFFPETLHDGSFTVARCGSTYIAPGVLLTARHCLVDDERIDENPLPLPPEISIIFATSQILRLSRSQMIFELHPNDDLGLIFFNPHVFALGSPGHQAPSPINIFLPNPSGRSDHKSLILPQVHEDSYVGNYVYTTNISYNLSDHQTNSNSSGDAAGGLLVDLRLNEDLDVFAHTDHFFRVWGLARDLNLISGNIWRMHRLALSPCYGSLDTQNGFLGWWRGVFCRDGLTVPRLLVTANRRSSSRSPRELLFCRGDSGSGLMSSGGELMGVVAEIWRTTDPISSGGKTLSLKYLSSAYGCSSVAALVDIAAHSRWIRDTLARYDILLP